jgi:hypothetical protein
MALPSPERLKIQAWLHHSLAFSQDSSTSCVENSGMAASPERRNFCIGLWYSLVIFRLAFVQEPADVTGQH